MSKKRQPEPMRGIATRSEIVHLMRILSRALLSRGRNVTRWEVQPGGLVTMQFVYNKLPNKGSF